MNKVLEFTGCKLAIRTESIKAIDIDPNDRKNIRLFIEGVYTPGGYIIHHSTEEDAERIYNQIIEEMRND